MEKYQSVEIEWKWRPGSKMTDTTEAEKFNSEARHRILYLESALLFGEAAWVWYDKDIKNIYGETNIYGATNRSPPLNENAQETC